MKESNNQKALEIKGKIDELRKVREGLISEIKDYRRKLEYKEAENIAISKFIESKKDSVQTKKIGYLKKQKNRLEFKLSTQARISLSEEKDIIRKINEMNSELEGLLKFVKLERKIGYIKDDITNYTSKLNETDKKIKDIDLQLDDLYRSLRSTLRIKPHGANEQYRPQKKQQQQPVQEINMEDIAVIKKKVQKKEEE
ncbi:hypothetical protein M1373_00030 [Candidatus Marsarchaeota archaeon]|nr:hypothetical protein [Candidatus Marsarchaeota archaeon]